MRENDEYNRSLFTFTNVDIPRPDLENLSRKRSGNDFFASRHFSCLLAYTQVSSIRANVTRRLSRVAIKLVEQLSRKSTHPSVIKLSVYQRRRLEPSRVIPSTFFFFPIPFIRARCVKQVPPGVISMVKVGR